MNANVVTLRPDRLQPRGKLGYPPEVRERWIRDLEAGKPLKDIAAQYGLSPKTVRVWWQRWKDSQGDPVSLMAQSRRPKHSPRRTPDNVCDRIMQLTAEGLGIYRIKRRLMEEFRYSPSTRTIWNIQNRRQAGDDTRERIASKATIELRNETAFLAAKVTEYEQREAQLVAEVAALKEGLRDSYMMLFRMKVRHEEELARAVPARRGIRIEQ